MNRSYNSLTSSSGEVMTPKTFLDENRICDLLDSNEPYWASKRDKKLITIKGNETIFSAMDLMSKHQILSLPVVEPENPQEFLGFVDMVDIIHSILCFYSESEDNNSCEKECPQWDKWCQDVKRQKKKSVEFESLPVDSIINQSKYDNFIPVDYRGTLRQIIAEVFQKDIHRVIVFNDDATGIGILSQTDVIKYFLENIDELGDCVHKSVGELNLIDDKVISMHEKGIAIHAYYLMLYHAVPGIAILNEKNEILSSISISDLRGMNKDTYQNLLKPATEFLHHKKAITCTKDTPLEVLMLTLFEHKIHRVWVVDSKETSKCTGVVTMVDIMKLFAKYKG